MACKYYINDEWVGEEKLKQLLHDGLLDQLVGTKNFKVDGFKPNQEYIESTYAGSVIEPVKLKVRRKINQPSLINTERRVNKATEGEYLGKATFEMPRKNPMSVLKDANEKIKKANKGKTNKAKGNRFILVTKIGGELKYGEGVSSEVVNDIKNSTTDIVGSLQEGKMYMLVRSADGLMPVWLRNSFLGETKDANQVKSALKSLFNEKLENKDREKAAAFIAKRLYGFTITFNDEGISLNKKNPDGSVDYNTLNTVEEAEEFILGTYNSKGEYTGQFNDEGKKATPGQIARVNHYDINSPSTQSSPFSNEYYADKGYITTDLFPDDVGNFFHSSSFALDTFRAEGDTTQAVDRMINDPQSNELKDNIEEEVAKDAVTPTVGNQNTKENENEAFIKKVEENELKKQEELEKSTEDKVDDAAARLFASSQELSKESKDLNEDSSEDSFGGGIFDANAGESLDDGSDVPKPKLAKPAEKQSIIDLSKELKEVERIVGKQASKVYGFESMEALEQYLPKDIYERLLRARKNGKVVHGLYTEAAVYLSKNAMAGTGYHEAFHVVFNLSLSLGQRMRLIYEAQEQFKDELSENPPFIETEELLADKFMEYVQSKGTPDKSLGKRISDYFKSLWRELQLFFHPNSRLSINKIFADMDLGVYRNTKANFSNTNLGKIDQSLVRFKIEERFEDINAETAGIEYLQYKVFRTIEEYIKKNPDISNLSDPEIISKIGINNFYSTLVQQVGNDIAAVKRDRTKALQEDNKERAQILGDVLELREKLLETMTNTKFDDIILLANEGASNKNLKVTKTEEGIRFNLLKPTEFLEKFTRSLRQFGIKISLDKVNLNTEQNLEDTSLEEGIELGEEYAERWQKAHIEFNPYDTISQQVKRKMATIPKMAPQKEGADKLVRNSFGSPTYYSSKDIYNYLGKNITDSYSVSEMVEKIENLKDEKPYMKDILSMVLTDVDFKNQLYTTLSSKTFQEFTLVYEKDGKYQVMASNRTGFNDIINQNIVGEFLVDNSKFFNKHKEGPAKGQTNFESPNATEINKIITKFKSLREKYRNLREKGEILETLDEISDVFKESNINLSTEQLRKIWNPERNTRNSSFANITKVLNKTITLFEELEKGNNPFLSMIPQEFLSEKNKEYTSTHLEEFTKSIMEAFDDELIAAFRNADNKTVYSIQLSNYLNKKLSKLKNKESLDKFNLRIKNDPILNKLPLLKSLQNEDGEMTGIAENLQVTVLDALARKGKKESIAYNDLSDPEMVATELALFHNSGNTRYGRFKFPIPSDAPTLPIIQHTKKTNEEIITDLTTIGMSEIDRIIKFKELPENAKLKRVANYNKNATKFNILSFLNDKISDPETVTEEQMEGYIKDYLENEFLELQKQKYKEIGAITRADKGKKGKIVFAEKIITSEKQGTAQEFFTNYLYNQYLMNAQLSTLFGGDPAFYKNTVDYQKRFKQIISPGTFTNHERIMPEYKGYIFADEYMPTQKETAEEIIKTVQESDLPQQKKLELTAMWEQLSNTDSDFVEDTNNITDAATFISIDRMVDIYDSLGRLTPEHEQAAERIRQGIELPTDAAMFQIFKPFQFTKINVDGVEVPVQVKNSEMVLTKSYASKSSKLTKMYEILNDPNNEISFIAFESAVKVGKIENSDSENNPSGYTTLENVGGEYQLSSNAEILSLLQEDWRLQQETPNHFIDDIGNFGSQLRVLAIADLDPSSLYKIGDSEYSSEEIAEMYQDLVVENIKESFEEVQDMFLDSAGNLDIEVLTEHLKQEITDRDLGEEYFEAIKLIDDEFTDKKTTNLPLWHPMLTYKVESLMNSFFKNRVMKQKINGGQLVNATSYGVADNLHYDAKTNTFDVILPQWTSKFFPKNEDGSPMLENIPKELLHSIAYRIPTEDKYSIFNLKVVGFSDAAAGGHIILPREATTLAGLDFDIDKMFIMIPNHRLDKKGNPVYIKNIDENSNISSEELAYNLTRSNNKLRQFLNEYLTKEDALEFEKEIKQARKNLRNAYKERASYFKGDSTISDTYNQFMELSLKLEYESSPSVIKASEQKLEDLQFQLEQYNKIKDQIAIENESKENLKLELENLIDELRESKEIDYSFFNSKESRDNRIIEILGGVMSNKNTALSSIDPGNFDKLRELGMKVRILNINSETENKKLKDIKSKGLKLIKDFNSNKLKLFKYRNELEKLIEQYEEEDFNINLPSTQLELFRRNMTGKELIGPIANHNTNHAKSQFTNLALVKPITFDGVQFSQLNATKSPFDNSRISKSLAIKLAAVVDNAKDPIASYLNLNMYTVNLIGLLSRLGVQEDTIFAYVNQPIIVELTKKYFNERGAIGDDAKRLFEVKKEWIGKLANKLKISPDKAKQRILNQGENLTKEELENAIANQGTEEYYETQLKVLNLFEEHFETAKELSKVVQASRVDTKGVGPTNGANYEMLSKQDKILNKDNPRILNAGELLYSTSTGNSLKMNPAFQKYSWLGAINVMNNVFPSIGKSDGQRIEWSGLGKIKNYFASMKKEGLALNEQEARNIDVAFMTALTSKIPMFKYMNEGKNQAAKIITETPKKLRKFKNENPDNKYSKFLNQLTISKPDSKVPYTTIRFHNTGRTSLDMENYRKLWELMLEETNDEIKDLAFDLVKYTYFTGGFNFGPFTFYNLVPVKFWTDKFARKPENAKRGLLTSDGKSHRQVLENELFKERNDIFRDESITRFLVQYMKNTAEKSAIIPYTEIGDIQTNIAPQGLPTGELASDEVLVMGTSNEGAHNAGISRFGYSLNNDSSFNPNVDKKGREGKYIKYGSTNEISEGNIGKGFGIQLYPEFFTDEGTKLEDSKLRLQTIRNNSTEEYQELREKQKASLKNSLNQLITTAKSNPDFNFRVTDLTGPFNFKPQEIRKMLYSLEKAYGDIPTNIALLEKYEIRKYGKSRVSEDGRLVIPTRTNQQLKRNDEFPAFLKAKVGKEIKLYRRIGNSTIETETGELKEAKTVQYNEIGTLGINNFLVEYNLDGNIEESALEEILKHEETNNTKETLVPSLSEPDLGISEDTVGAIDKLMSSQIQGNTNTPSDFKTKTKEKPKGLPSDFMFDEQLTEEEKLKLSEDSLEDIENATDGIVEESIREENRKATDITYNNYIRLFQKAVQENRENQDNYIKLEDWETYPTEVRKNIIECL